MQFIFETSGIVITIKPYEGVRQIESNDGVDINIESNCPHFSSGFFRLQAASDFSTKGKQMSELYYPSYRTQDIDQAKAINKLNDLCELINENKNENEIIVLLKLGNYIKKSLIRAFCMDANLAIQPLSFIVPGKRVDESTFELIDASEYQKQQEEKGVATELKNSINISGKANSEERIEVWKKFVAAPVQIRKNVPPIDKLSSSSDSAPDQNRPRPRRV